MPKYPFMQVDAFTSTPLGGNPCAIVFDADTLDRETMQAIAKENNLSETAFVLQPTAEHAATAEIRARYFTPSEEIPLAGHPTIATIFALVQTGRLPMRGDQMTIRLELRDGPIPVEIFAGGGVVERVVMTQRKPQFLAEYDPAEVMPIFGLAPEEVVSGAKIQTVSTGTPQLMIPVRNIDTLQRIAVDMQALTRLHADGDFFSLHLFCTQGYTKAGDTFARHFAPPPDLFEDPYTGSATGGMAAYLWRYGLIENPLFIAEQGHIMERPGSGTVEVIGPRESIEAVKVGGSAVTVITGELTI